MTQTNTTTQRMSDNRTRTRLQHGEVNERRQRNDKLHKPSRIADNWNDGSYSPANMRNLRQRKRILHHELTSAYIENQNS